VATVCLCGWAVAPAAPPPARGTAGHWAFRPPVRPAPPAVKDPAAIRNDLDRFVQAKLEEKGLGLAPEADRATLIRRVSYDLTGLPPSPSEIAEFLSDPAPGAYERLVDRYLESPRYGERWGRHWLDAAGYADSNGYFSADSDRPHAWRYRDYVVRALNADKPFDRFVEEQLAGDELAGYRPDMDVTGETVDLLTATHFLRNSQDGTGESDGNQLEVLADKLAVLEGTVHIIGSSLLGLTLQCARCHEHKFDPVSQEEYYELEAIFAGAYSPERWQKPSERLVAIGTRAEREEHRRREGAVEAQLKVLQSSLDGFAAPFRRQAQSEDLQKLAGLDAAEREALRQAIETPEERRGEEARRLLKKHEKALRVEDDELAKRFPEYARVRGEIQTAREAKEKERPAPLGMLSVFIETRPDPPPHRLLVAGLPSRPGPVVEPGVPAVLCSAGNAFRIVPSPADAASSGRRLAFAQWLTSPGHPLLARVTVNRIWQQHFGTGIVSTSDNFGASGSPPAHPELLDYLATELIARGWSLKSLHRLIVGSAAYRQSSALRSNAVAVDPEGRLLWRYPPRRLEAEAVRDAMLFVSGELDLSLGGPYVPARHAEDGQVSVDESAPGACRRSLYLQQRRTQPLTWLEVFDAPLIVASCARRIPSTTPLQSLAFLNSDFALARARAFAGRLAREAGAGAGARVGRAFLLALGRGPTELERAAAEKFLAGQEAEHQGPEAAGQALADFCQTLLAANAFLYVE
jgi:hypothetical protein